MNTLNEFERKIILSAEQYEQYYKLFSKHKTPSVILQMNYYYDDDVFSLFERDETLRVRQIGENLTLEYKYSKTYIGDIRKSKETGEIIFALPKMIRLDLLEAYMIGCLLTERTNFIFKDSKVSLDKSVYLGITDYELEIETNNDAELPTYITDVISSNATCSCIGKYSRFVSRMKEINTIYEI